MVFQWKFGPRGEECSKNTKYNEHPVPTTLDTADLFSSLFSWAGSKCRSSLLLPKRRHRLLSHAAFYQNLVWKTHSLITWYSLNIVFFEGFLKIYITDSGLSLFTIGVSECLHNGRSNTSAAAELAEKNHNILWTPCMWNYFRNVNFLSYTFKEQYKTCLAKIIGS